MRNRLNWRHFFGAVVLGSVMFFQNCSDMGEEDSQSSLSYTEKLPFAYDATLDTIAYMSCSRMKAGFEPRAFFSFRAGSYTSMSGLQVNQEFYDATKYYSLDSKAQAFAGSPANMNARMQLALRSTANLQSVVVNGAAKNGTSLGTMMSDLSEVPLVQHLATMQPGVRKHYFPSANESRLMESSLRFNDGSEENVVGAVRTLLRDREAVLALTYTGTDSADDKSARGPKDFDPASVNDTTKEVFGVGYQLQFKSPLNWATAEQRVLASVNEVKLAPGFTSTSSVWTCPTSMQFVVVRNEDIARVSPCDLSVDYYSNETQRLALDVIRRVLPVEDFFVDVVNRCIVAKPHISGQSCYGDRTGRGAIDYSSGSCSGDSCPHYVSVCIKSQ